MQAKDGLGERKLKILHAIIQNYLETGEPVGSRTISKYTDLNLISCSPIHQREGSLPTRDTAYMWIC